MRIKSEIFHVYHIAEVLQLDEIRVAPSSLILNGSLNSVGSVYGPQVYFDPFVANIPILYALIPLVFSVGIKWEHWPEMS